MGRGNRQNGDDKKFWWLCLIVGMCLLGLGLRVFKAWTIALSPDSDHGIVYLMVKHMVEGTDYPVFFYGQPYMGSLEPVISALVCRIGGVSAFNVCLGTVLAGIPLLPLIYGWGFRAGGRRVGLVALLLALVGTTTNFHYSVAPRGGYMAMMVCGVGTVYLACTVVSQMRAGQRVRRGSYLMLGLLAGLGWWSNQLMVAFLLATLVILLAGISWRMVKEGVLPSLVMFFVGSAPWWFWNVTHDWGTFEFTEALGRVTFGQGVRAFAQTVIKALELQGPWNSWHSIVLMVTGGLVLLYLVQLYQDWTDRKVDGQLYFRLAAPVLCLALGAVSFKSKYILGSETSRYMLPLFPALAIMLAWSADWIMRRKHGWLGWVLVILVVPRHLYSLPQAVDERAYGCTARANGQEIIATISSLCEGACIGNYVLHRLNFDSNEKVCVATLPLERYAPFARRVELAEHPAILNDYCGLHSFLTNTGGRSREREVAGVHVDYDLMPPSDSWGYVEGSAIRDIRDDQGALFREVLTDNTLNTAWRAELHRGQEAGLTVEFDKPHNLCGVRFVSRIGEPPGFLRISVQMPESTNWCEVLPWTAPSSYFWSGSHIKLDGMHAYEEIRFACPTGGVTRVQLKFGLADSRARIITLDELRFLEQGVPPVGVPPSPDACLALLQEKQVRQFRGPRWMTERLSARDTGLVKVERPSFMTRSIYDLPEVDSSRADKVYFEETTGLLMDSREVPRSRAILEKCNQQWEEIRMGSLTLMVVAPAKDDHDWIRHTPVYWTELGCFAEESARSLKRRAECGYQEAMHQKARGETGVVTGTLARVLALYEGHQPARRELAMALKVGGKVEESVNQELILARQVDPEIPAAAGFPDGIQFLGLNLSTNEVVAGQSITITYYWTCATSVRKALYNVFVHFRKGKECFQDDHELMNDMVPENIEYQPFREVFSYTRRITVPVTAIPGNYRIVFGIVNRHTRQRVEPETRLTVKMNGIDLPVIISVH